MEQKDKKSISIIKGILGTKSISRTISISVISVIKRTSGVKGTKSISVTNSISVIRVIKSTCCFRPTYRVAFSVRF